eukprot:5637078-Prorocentrum_lima.AAC.1
MEAKYYTSLACTSTENLDMLEKAEELLISQTEYQTCKWYGEKKVEYLQTLDSVSYTHLRAHETRRHL